MGSRTGQAAGQGDPAATGRSRAGGQPRLFDQRTDQPHEGAARRELTGYHGHRRIGRPARSAHHPRRPGQRDPRQAEVRGRQGRRPRPRPRLVHRDRARGARPGGRPLDRDHPQDLRDAPEAGLLPVGRVPDRPPAQRISVQPAAHRHLPRGPGRARRRSRPHQGARAGRRARQRRPRPARRLLHGEHGDRGHRRLRLRHPLSAWPVPAAVQRRLAGRAAGGLAGLRQSLGVRAPRGHLRDRLRRRGRKRGRQRALGAPGLATGRAGARDRLRHADRRLGRPLGEHAAPVVGRRREPDALRPVQQRRLHGRGRRPGQVREHRADPLSERRHAGRPGAAPDPGVLLHLGLAPGSAAPAHPAGAQSRRRCPRRSRSSSTTPIRRSRSPS